MSARAQASSGRLGARIAQRLALSLALGLALGLAVAACSEADAGKAGVPGHEGASKTVASLRAGRRLFDGAPPVIPHQRFGPACTACHNERGLEVPEVGFAPPSPHELTAGMSAMSRCEQCHVFRQTDGLFRENLFAGLAQDLRKGQRLYAGAPPVIPHLVQMRENCTACHSGPAAREEIRCPHPERQRCQQCHVQAATRELFVRPIASGG